MQCAGWSGGNGYGAALRTIFDPEGVMDRLVEELLTVITAAGSAMIGLVEEAGTIRIVRSAGTLHSLDGAAICGSTSLSGLAILSGSVQTCDDASTDPRVDRAMLELAEMSSMVAVPLLREKTAFGVVDIIANRPHAFTDEDVTTCRALADVLAGVISLNAEAARILSRLDAHGPPLTGSPLFRPLDADVIGRFVTNVLSPATTRQLDTHRRISKTLEAGTIRMTYQPIVSLETSELRSVEALARFDGPPNAPPDQWFAEAADVGLGVELEMLAFRTALGALPELPSGVTLAVNLGSKALLTPAVLVLLQNCQAERVVIELTEHAPVADYPALSSVIATVRRLGTRLAVDDTGAGFSSLAHIARLEPDFVKLDRWIVSGIDANPARRALATALVSYAHSFGGQVVGEGIETAEERQALEESGVDYGQGFYIGRPAGIADALALASGTDHPGARHLFAIART